MWTAVRLGQLTIRVARRAKRSRAIVRAVRPPRTGATVRVRHGKRRFTVGDALVLIGFASTVVGFVTLLIRALNNSVW